MIFVCVDPQRMTFSTGILFQQGIKPNQWKLWIGSAECVYFEPTAAIIATSASHILTRSFFISSISSFVGHLADFFESCRFLWRVVWIVLMSTRHGPEWISWHLSLVILRLGSNISNGSLCDEVPLICCDRSPPSPLDKPLYLHSHQSLVTVDLLGNFLKLLKVFSCCGEWFYEIVVWQYDGEWEGVRSETWPADWLRLELTASLVSQFFLR